MAEAHLDRRVSISSGENSETFRLSQLRERPFLVMLGEPGIGKSTALRVEAAAEGGSVLTCREVMNGVPLRANATAYLDALDEFRSGGDGKDKLLQLAVALGKADSRRWRLTCRAEDWRKAADLAAMARAAPGGTIDVVHLLPLDEGESEIVLRGLGEKDPQNFLQRARQQGAEGFLQSPLSLKLLHAAVSTQGDWPSSRFELFQSATSTLAHEDDPARAFDVRPSSGAIIDAAGILNLQMLATGARAIRRSNAPVPASRNADFVNVTDLPIDRSIADQALDTALFRGEGEVFEPMHRSVAEFLAGRSLARTVAGSHEAPAFPLSRALALITGPDGKAPSELRGLFAWFAAHLAHLNDNPGAMRLIERDTATVLAYGDAAAFATEGRRAILRNLDREDPYFRASQRDDSTAVGGLAGDDLADDFLTILDGPDTPNHLQLTVLVALVEGNPIARLQPKLYAMVFDAAQPMWQRARAAQAWINGSADRMAARRLLVDQLAKTPVTGSQISLRAGLSAGLPADQISTAEVRRLLADVDSLPGSDPDDEDTSSGSLTSLLLEFRHHPRPDFFDQRILPDRPEGSDRLQKFEVRYFVNQTLAAAIEQTPGLESSRLLKWIQNVQEFEWDTIESDVAEAIGTWLEAGDGRRELELFLAILDASDPAEGAWMVGNRYITTARREPTLEIFRSLLRLADQESTAGRRRRLFEVAAHIAHLRAMGAAAHWELLAALRDELDSEALIETLTSVPIESWRSRQMEQNIKSQADTLRAKQNNIAKLTPVIQQIAEGNPTEYGALRWGADLYYSAILGSGAGDALSKIVKFSSPEIAAAIASGLVQFAARGDVKVDAKALGESEARNKGFEVERVVAAGLHRGLSTGRNQEFSACPLSIAIIAIRQGHINGDHMPSISDWAFERLGAPSSAGAQELLTYWYAALDEGDEDLDGIHRLLERGHEDLAKICLRALLAERPNLPRQALYQTLLGAAVHLPISEVSEFARAALANVLVVGEQRALWSFVAFAIDPATVENQLGVSMLRDCLVAPGEDLANAYLPMCPAPEQMDGITIASVGAVTPPDRNDWKHGITPSGTVRSAIARLGSSNSSAAGVHLRKLIADTALSPWQPDLRHALAEHSRIRRDNEFRPPTPAALTAALSGREPANSADLMAVVVEELERYRATLRTGSEMPWKRFWNTGPSGNPTSPQVENEDRDRLLELLRPRFERYGIMASLPEARRGENTRADILLLSHAGMNLPIEAKRHHNVELWTAPNEQLRGYAEDQGAGGYGIYLVFWFGTSFNVPARPNGKVKPTSAVALEGSLIEDLPLDMASRTSVIVLDVSKPGANPADI